MAEQVEDGAGAAPGAGRQDARRRRGPAARLGALRRARVDARDARHGPQPRPQRHQSVEGLARATENERFAWDSYRRFVQMFGNVSRGIAGRAVRGRDQGGQGGPRRQGRHGARRRRAEGAHGALQGPLRASRRTRRSSCARRSARCSTPGPASARSSYRRLNRIPDEWGTAVNVQQMVFGNKGDTSGSGVAFSRDEVTGEPEPSGDFLHQRPGRGRRLRRAQHARHRRAGGRDAGGARGADGDPAHARGATTRTCRTRSSRSRRGSCTCSRRATPSARRRRRCASRATRSTRGC